MSGDTANSFGKSEITALYSDGRTLAVLAAASASLKAIFVKLVYQAGSVDAITALTLRMILVLPAFLWMARGALAPLTSRQRSGLLATGALGYYLSSLFDFEGLRFISAGLERLILFSYPPLVILIESVWRRRPAGRRLWAGMAVTYAGLLFAFAHDLRFSASTGAILTGGGWVLASSICFALNCVGSAAFISVIGPRRLVGMAGTVAASLVFGHFLLTHSLQDLTGLPAPVWGWSAALAIVSTLLPSWLSARAMEEIGAGRTSAIGMLGPALTIAFGWLVLGEVFSWGELVGVTLVTGGVWWIGRKT